MFYKDFLNGFKSVIPPLTNLCHKGSNGRIGIIGGSLEYTGAPYFAAISALKAGADLVHVFCCNAAAPVIKSYSPELIVHPLLDSVNGALEISKWTDRLHSLVIGPGLGRDPETFETVFQVLKKVKKIPIVLDADGLFMLTVHPEMKNLLDKLDFIITPNAIELSRLKEKFPDTLNAVYVVKGENDVILSKGCEIVCSELGSPRRCGGQGDVLSGIIGTFSAWASIRHPEVMVNSVVAASALTRRCSYLAFGKYKRSMVAGNLIEFVGPAFEDLFGQ